MALAAALRFSRGDVVEYFHDDAMLATLALELADGLTFPLTGILSSTGIPNPPVSVYALALPFALSSSPAFVIHVIMAWNVIGVALLWRLARRYGGRRIALIAGLLYAINPWAILFSRKIWAQELHTPIILFGLLLLLHGFCETRAGRPRTRSVALAQCLSLPVLLFAFQFHFASGPLLALIPAAVWKGRQRIHFRALIAGHDFVTDCGPRLTSLASGRRWRLIQRVFPTLWSDRRGVDPKSAWPPSAPSRGSPRALAWNTGWRLIRRRSWRRTTRHRLRFP